MSAGSALVRIFYLSSVLASESRFYILRNVIKSELS